MNTKLKEQLEEIAKRRAQPLLREMVFVNIDGNDGTTFSVLLTRVPCVGEEINRKADSYRVVRVRHDEVDDDGRARFGYHAWLDAEFVPEPTTPPLKRKLKWPMA